MAWKYAGTGAGTGTGMQPRAAHLKVAPSCSSASGMELLLAASFLARSRGTVSQLGWAPQLSLAAPGAAWSSAPLALRSAGGGARLRSLGEDGGGGGLGAPESAAVGSAAPRN